MFRRRIYLDKLEMYLHRDVLKLIIGARRSGKTTIIKQFIEQLEEEGVSGQDILYVDLEDMRHTYLDSAAGLRDLLVGFAGKAQGHAYIFLDEVQGIADWADVASEMMNLHDCDIFVSASNVSIFSGGFAKALAYRYVRIDVWPLSFSEYLKLRAWESEASLPGAADGNCAIMEPGPEEGPSDRDYFYDYLAKGGMPGVYSLRDGTDPSDYLKGVYNTIILRDVVQCNSLRDISHIDKIMEYLMSHTGETFSPKAVRDYVRSRGIVISVDTVYSCLDALCGAFLIYKVPRYDVKADRELETLEKYYICDTAMLSAVMGKKDLSPKADLENIICREMLSRGFTVFTARSGKSLADIMAVRGYDRTYINICGTVSEKEAVKDAFGPLTRIKDNYFKMVLSLDPETIVNKGGIINYPVIRFLMEG